MKKYYICKGSFSNVYDLLYTVNDEQAPAGYERITRKEAECYARKEARRRKENASFAYYAPALIRPITIPDGKGEDYTRIEDWARHGIGGWSLDGRIICYNRRPADVRS